VRLVALVAMLVVAGCGARTALDAPEPSDGGAPVPETCDGLDEDGDGRVDEGIPPRVCGDARCPREVAACVDGSLRECPPVVVEPETCNRRDDDCDGRVDEGLGFGPIGDPIVIRDIRDERTLDDCTSCYEVLDVQLATFGRELHAVWHLFFVGVIDVPNTYARRLSDRGEPLEPSRPLFDAVTTRVALAPSHSGQTIASYCERHDDSIDYPGSRFLDARGRPVGGAVERGDADVRCLRPPSVLWTGERHLFLRNLTGEQLSIESADRDGSSRGLAEVSWPWFGAAPAVAFDGEVALLAFNEGRDLRVVEIAADGTPTSYSVPAALGRPDEGRYDVGRMPIHSDGDGFLLGADRFVTTHPFDRTADRALDLFRYDRRERALTRLGSTPIATNGPIQLSRRGPGELLVVGSDVGRGLPGGGSLEVLLLSDTGERLERWVFEPDDGIGEGIRAVDVHAHGSSIYVAYVRVLDHSETRIELLELGCSG